MSTVARFFRLNPVALREMRTRMRGPRSFALLGLYLAILTGLIYAVYLRSGGGSSYPYGSTSASNYGPTTSFQIGQNIFITVFLFLLVMVALITPGITASAISREMENKTYEMLVVTPVSGRALVFGKLLSSLGFVFFMIIATLPLACIVFIFGGVDMLDLFAGFLIAVTSALAFGTIGFFFSAWLRRTAPAVVATYVVIMVLVAGSWLISSSVVAVINGDDSRLTNIQNRPDPRTDPAFNFPKRVLVFNPVAAIGSILTPNAPFRASPRGDLQYFPSSQVFGGDPRTYFNSPSSQSTPAANALARKPVLPTELPLWVGYSVIYFGIAILFLLLSLLVVKPESQYRLFKRRARPDKPAKPKRTKIKAEKKLEEVAAPAEA